MFRAVVFSIALTVAAGPSVALLCGTWCDRQATAASGSRHEEPATSVAAGDSCDSMALSAAAFLREKGRRGVSAPEAGHAVLVPRYQLARSATEPNPHHKPGLWSLEIPPLATVLRI
jgi:hypothetical protein